MEKYEIIVKSIKFNKKNYEMESSHMGKYYSYLCTSKMHKLYSKINAGEDLYWYKDYCNDMLAIKKEIPNLPKALQEEVLQNNSIVADVEVKDEKKNITFEKQLLLSDNGFRLIYTYNTLMKNVETLNKLNSTDKTIRDLKTLVNELKDNYSQKQLYSSLYYNTYVVNNFIEKLNIKNTTEHITLNDDQKEILKYQTTVAKVMNNKMPIIETCELH